jgi:hypothetical protein
MKDIKNLVLGILVGLGSVSIPVIMSLLLTTLK